MTFAAVSEVATADASPVSVVDVAGWGVGCAGLAGGGVFSTGVSAGGLVGRGRVSTWGAGVGIDSSID